MFPIPRETKLKFGHQKDHGKCISQDGKRMKAASQEMLQKSGSLIALFS
jgi:hypothetical protein